MVNVFAINKQKDTFNKSFWVFLMALLRKAFIFDKYPVEVCA